MKLSDLPRDQVHSDRNILGQHVSIVNDQILLSFFIYLFIVFSCDSWGIFTEIKQLLSIFVLTQ